MKDEQRIFEFMKKLGVPSHVKGYHYIKAALPMMLEVHSRGETIQVTKVLYPTIAKQFNTTASRVERAIRHAVQRTFDVISSDVYDDVFGELNHMVAQPTNSQFLTICAGYLLHNQMDE